MTLKKIFPEHVLDQDETNDNSFSEISLIVEAVYKVLYKILHTYERRTSHLHTSYIHAQSGSFITVPFGFCQVKMNREYNNNKQKHYKNVNSLFKIK